MRLSFSGILVRYEYEDANIGDKYNKLDNAHLTPNSELYEFYREDELHVNLWETGRDQFSPFLDIGVMVKCRDLVKSIVVDVPWLLDARDVSDLGARLNGEKSVAAIFNEVVHYDGFAEGNFANISFRKDGVDHKPFTLLRLNSNSFKVEPSFLSDDTSCTRLTVSLPKVTPKDDSDKRKSAYIRFRIKKVPPKVYSVQFDQKDRSLISSINETRIVDFRINVLRGVPEELISSEVSLAFPKFERIHCFLTTLRDEECASVTSNYKGYRSLMDEDVWNEYIRLDSSEGISEATSVRNYLGYQWTASSTKSGPAKDLIVLGRFSKVRSDYASIFRFIGFVILFGAVGSGVWDLGSGCVFSEHFWCNGCWAKLGLVTFYVVLGLSIAFGAVVWNNLMSRLTSWWQDKKR